MNRREHSSTGWSVSPDVALAEALEVSLRRAGPWAERRPRRAYPNPAQASASRTLTADSFRHGRRTPQPEAPFRPVRRFGAEPAGKDASAFAWRIGRRLTNPRACPRFPRGQARLVRGKLLERAGRTVSARAGTRRTPGPTDQRPEAISSRGGGRRDLTAQEATALASARGDLASGRKRSRPGRVEFTAECGRRA